MRSSQRNYSNTSLRTWYETLIGASNSLNNSRQIAPFFIDYELPSNRIHTSKYTWFNYIPKNLWEQFTKLPNIYFLIIGIFQILPQTSNTNSIPTIYIPLTIIFFITAIRDLYEDYKRQLSDRKQNSIIYSEVTQDGTLSKIKCENIFPGMVIRINNGQMIPCDGIIVYSPSEIAYCNTKNLDGQSNLKKKIFFPQLSEKVNVRINPNRQQQVTIPNLLINYQKPNTMLNSFRGSMILENKQYYLSEKNVCLRSSYLMNSKYVYLLVLYTGHDTKVLLSMNKTQFKRSNLQKKMNIFILIIAICVILLAISMALITEESSEKYRHFIFGKKSVSKYFLLTNSFTWLLNITNLIPISLMFTLETVKFFEGKLIQCDSEMKSQQFSTIVNCSSIIQQLGQIQYVASDKTGTITKNNLILKKISDGTKIYYQQSYIPQNISLFMMVSHQVYVNEHNYEGVSLDQVAILNFLKNSNNKLHLRSTKQMIVEINNKKKSINILSLIEFTSQRKRESIIVEIDSKYYIISKGADDVMLPRMLISDNFKNIKKDADDFSNEGLRTLIYGYKQIERYKILSWVQQFDLCRIKGVSETYCTDKIQIELFPLCCTGIEDELVDGIQNIVQKIFDANMKFMIISGDKPETVMSIAKSISKTIPPLLSDVNQYKQQYSYQKFIVFARCTPKQKQQIVSQIKGKVLAIGDGANDVSMLIKADVGIGISGKQGQSAIQSSDFGIPSFTHLDRLLFHYGLKFNKNNAVLIRYNFYKNFLFTFPLIVFGYYSFSSGVYLYNSYIAQLFNLLFTSIPIGSYALFQQQSQTKDDYQQSLNYKFNRQKSLFSIKHILLDFFESAIQSYMSSYVCFEMIPIMFTSPNDLNMYQSSSILLFFVVIISNAYLVMITKQFYNGIILSIFFGICCYILAYSVITSFGKYQIVKESFKILSKPASCFILILTVMLGLIISLVIDSIHKVIINIQKPFFNQMLEQQNITNLILVK